MQAHDLTTYKFPATKPPHMTTVKDKTRNSGLTAVRMIGGNRVVAADFNEKAIYLCSLEGDKLTIIDQKDTVIESGEAVETDLIDYRDGVAVVTNFYQGSISFYDVTEDAITFREEHNYCDVKNLHGVRFVPGYPDLLWLTYCNKRNKRFQIVNYKTREVLHDIPTDQQCQDVAFVGNYAVVFARTDHITVGTKKPLPFTRKWRMFATAYVFDFTDLDTRAPQFVSRWKGKGHIDATMEFGTDKVLAANQYLNRVDVFQVSPDGQLTLADTIDGFGMPHGLDHRDGRLAVTNYLDQSLKVGALPI